jgi:hypothetical protein
MPEENKMSEYDNEMQRLNARRDFEKQGAKVLSIKILATIIVIIMILIWFLIIFW